MAITALMVTAKCEYAQLSGKKTQFNKKSTGGENGLYAFIRDRRAQCWDETVNKKVTPPGDTCCYAFAETAASDTFGGWRQNYAKEWSKNVPELQKRLNGTDAPTRRSVRFVYQSSVIR
jgi:hypothetical protein